MVYQIGSDVYELAQELSRYTGETVPEATRKALQERLQREKRKREQLKERLLRIGKECAALPVLDNRTPDDILGYNRIGVPE